MNKIIKKLSILLFALLLTFSNPSNLLALSASISVSSSASKVVVGNTFSVTIKVSSSTALGSWEFTPSYDKNLFKLVSGESPAVGYASNSSTKSKSYSYKFKAISNGTGKISVKSYGVYAYNESKLSVSVSSKSVTVITKSQQEASYSKNNNLKSLKIDGLKLSPSFSKYTTKYKATAESNTTKINIKAYAEDSKSKVSGTGTKKVSEGENKFNITVKAENGTTKTYTVIVNVIDPKPIEVTVNDIKYTVVKRESNLDKISDFKSSTTKINDQSIPCLYNETNDYTLVGLKNSDGDISMFLYDKQNNTYSLYEDAKLSQMNIYPLEIEDSFKPNEKRTQIKIDDVDFDAIMLSASGLYIVKARDLDNATDEYYEYDEKTNTLIRYIEVENDTEDDYTSKDEQILKYKKMMVLLSIETIVVILILICILIGKMKKNKRRKQRLEEEKKRLEEKKKQELEEEKKELNTKKKKSTKKKEVLKNEKKKNN